MTHEENLLEIIPTYKIVNTFFSLSIKHRLLFNLHFSDHKTCTASGVNIWSYNLPFKFKVPTMNAFSYPVGHIPLLGT